MKNIYNDESYKKYLAPKPVLLTVAVIILIALVIIAYQLITGTTEPVPWESSGPIGL